MLEPLLELPIINIYELAPRGLIAPGVKKEFKLEPDKVSIFEKIFDEWKFKIDEADPSTGVILVNTEIHYKKAEELLKYTECTSNQITEFLIANKENLEFWESGVFISALYQKVPEKIIVYDLNPDRRLDYLGYKLPAGKTLIITGNAKVGSNLGKKAEGNIILEKNASAGYFTGEDSKGFVIIKDNASVEKLFGKKSSGPVIITGKAGVPCNEISEEATGPLIIIQEQNKKFCDYAGQYSKNLVIIGNNISTNTIYEKEFIFDANGENIKREFYSSPKQLNLYLQNLSQKLNGSYREIAGFLDSFGPEPGKTIEAEIRQILKGGSYTCKI